MSLETSKGTDYDRFVLSLGRWPKAVESERVVSAMYCALGLTGEAGETADKIKKWHRDGVLIPEAIKLELGDVLYYLTALANTLGFTLQDVMDANEDKLVSRRDRNQIHGSGDNR